MWKCPHCNQPINEYEGEILVKRVIHHNKVIDEIAAFLDREGHPELATKVCNAFMDSAGE